MRRCTSSGLLRAITLNSSDSLCHRRTLHPLLLCSTVFPPLFPSLNLPHLCFFHLPRLITSTHPVPPLSQFLNASRPLCNLCAPWLNSVPFRCSICSAEQSCGKWILEGQFKGSGRTALQICVLTCVRLLLAASALDDAVGLFDWRLVDEARVLGVTRLQDVTFFLVSWSWRGGKNSS